MTEIKKIYLFEQLNDRQLERLKQISVVKEFKKGNHLFFEGDEPKNLHILTDGVVKVYKSGSEGHEVVLKYFYPVSLIAELANLDHIPYPASAVFETDGKVIALNFTLFEEEFLKNPDISTMIIKSLTKKMKNLETVISQSLKSATARVAGFIYENGDLFSQLKKHKVASILNITPETLSRILTKLKKRGILSETRDKQLHIIDKEKLKSFFS